MKVGQVILGFIFAFAAILLLTIGIVRTWTWFSANYAHKEVAYQRSRLSAGQPDTYGDSGGETYVDIAGAGASYQGLNLTEDWVFRGQAQGVGSISGSAPSWEEVTQCCKNCSLGLSYDSSDCSCDGADASCGSSTNFNANCGTYTKCICWATVAPTTDMLLEQRAAICGDDVINGGDPNCNQCPSGCGSYSDNERCYDECHSGNDVLCEQCMDQYRADFGNCGQYCNMLHNADQMDDQADECDDPWEICWWGTWGAVADELRDGADELRSAAEELRKDALELKGMEDRLEDCCEQGGTLNSTYDCIEAAQQSDCSSMVDPSVADMQSQVADLQQQKGELEQEITDINSHVSNCNSEANTYCTNQCQSECTSVCWDHDEDELDTDCYNACYNSCMSSANCTLSNKNKCYPNCYESRRNSCCRNYEGMGRNCDEPTANCDLGGSSPNCGLTPLTTNIQNKINNELVPGMAELEQKINALEGCCNLPEAQQWDCILGGM